jgi:hypothetical protein
VCSQLSSVLSVTPAPALNAPRCKHMSCRWECANWAAVTGHEVDYVRPLGPPLVPAMNCRAGPKAGEVDCSRKFATGTCAYVSTHGADARSCVWWSDGAEVGDAATCANSSIRTASCGAVLSD